MTTTQAETLKQKHRAMWASGDYPQLADVLITSLGEALVDALAITRGDRVLDVAAGSGNAALPAALTGADVVASDLTPELLEAGRSRAAERGAQLDWQVADAEALPFDDGAFDVVMSCVGVMFAPHHQASADELVRVCKPGGRIGLLSWTPTGFIGRMFATMRPYVAPPPPGAQPPLLWGEEAHVRDLFGDRVTDVSARTAELVVDAYADGAAFRDHFKTAYGPTVAACQALAGDPERTAALDRDLAALGDGGLHEGRMEWQYLLLTAQRV